MKNKLFLGLLALPLVLMGCGKKEKELRELYVQSEIGVKVGETYDVVVSTKPQIDGLEIGCKFDKNYINLERNTTPHEIGEYGFTLTGMQATVDKPIAVSFYVGAVEATTAITVTA